MCFTSLWKLACCLTHSSGAAGAQGRLGDEQAKQRALTDILPALPSTEEARQWDLKLLDLLIMARLPFRLVMNPYFMRWIRAVRPGYMPAGKSGCT